jgi:hypothetical protein
MSNQESLRDLVRAAVRQALSETATPESPGYFAPWTGVEYETHPSRSQFHILEAATATDELVEFAAPASCSIEKNKSCDHCGMCKSLGF